MEFVLKPDPLTFDQLNLEDRYLLLDSLPKTYQLGVEIGVWQGWYMRHLLLRTSMHIYGIDPWVATESYEDVDPKAPGFDPMELGDDGYKWQETRYVYTMALLRDVGGGKGTLYRSYSHLVAPFVAPETVDFVYIDGEHTYDAVTQDIADWWPKVRPGGIMAGHDYNETNPGTKRAVNEFAEKHGLSFKITGTNPEKGDADAPSWVFIKGAQQ